MSLFWLAKYVELKANVCLVSIFSLDKWRMTGCNLATVSHRLCESNQRVRLKFIRKSYDSFKSSQFVKNEVLLQCCRNLCLLIISSGFLPHFD